jgi:Zn finger protein HypA/HybF involved in hydrogenase expression
MTDKPIEIADVLRRFIGDYEKQFADRMLPSQRKAIKDIIECMTEAKGGGRYRCGDCDETFWSYHGCRNRSCPKCHGRQMVLWMEKRSQEMLPCPYFHVIATVPSALRPLFLREQAYLYGLLMKSAAAALCELAEDERYVGATPGILAVLHTWTAQMHHHPHVHMLVTGGGMSNDGSTWHPAQPGFLVPVKKLSPMISRRFAEALEKERPDLFSQVSAKTWKREWCSFCKAFGRGRDAVLRYLARYVFRIAITSNRIIAMDETHVTFRYKDNSTGEHGTQRIPGVDFIRRFLLHVLPRGFHKVRYYGLSHPSKRDMQDRARAFLLLSQDNNDQSLALADLAEEALDMSDIENHAFVIKCPTCKSANVDLIQRIERRKDVT